MRAGRTWPLAAAVIVVLALAAPAAAHENGLGLELADRGPSRLVLAEHVEPDRELRDGRQRRARPSRSARTATPTWPSGAGSPTPVTTRASRSSTRANPRKPKQLVDFACPGSQHDVSVWGGLLFVSVETPRTSPACDSTAQPSGTPGFEGIRIFDVSNPRSPVLIAGVRPTAARTPTRWSPTRATAACCSTSPRTRRAELAPVALRQRMQARSTRTATRCTTRSPSSRSRCATRARQASSASRASRRRSTAIGWYGCHDITVFMELEKAAGACMGEGQIWDISDLEHPATVGRVFNPNVEFFHSATFSYDGRRVIFGDEAGGGTGPALHARPTRPRAARCGSTTSASIRQPRRGGRAAAQLVEGAAHPGEADARAGAGPQLHDAQLQHAADRTRRRAGLVGLCGRDHDGRLHECLAAA